MPCRNEEKFIAKTIESLMDDYCQNNCELLIADGGSTDRTKDIIRSLIKKGLPIKLLENEKKLQAFGINIGIINAKGNFIARTDVHCLYPPEYIKNCLNLLETKNADNAGGIMSPRGSNTVQNANAIAMKHPLGVGDAKFHLGDFSGYVDTVYLGIFRKNLFEEIGLYDPQAHPNEDAELNLRILKAGKKIYLDSSIEVIYFPRESFLALAKQYFRYGRGRAYTTWKHKKFTSWRQAAPPFLIIGLIGFPVLSFFEPLFLLFPVLYIAALIISAIFWTSPRTKTQDEKREGFLSCLLTRFLIVIAFVTMHVSWGTGFLARLLRLVLKRKDRRDESRLAMKN